LLAGLHGLPGFPGQFGCCFDSFANHGVGIDMERRRTHRWTPQLAIVPRGIQAVLSSVGWGDRRGGGQCQLLCRQLGHLVVPVRSSSSRWIIFPVRFRTQHVTLICTNNMCIYPLKYVSNCTLQLQCRHHQHSHRPSSHSHRENNTIHNQYLHQL
jgi:hypothetical protein